MIINEIFESIDGEARRAGELATFVRTNLCNLRCSWCDTKYSWGEEKGKEMTADEVIEECIRLGHKNITLTGGEPLIQKDTDELIMGLSEEGFDVSIETNGSIDWSIHPWFHYDDPNVWVCADYKCPSCGETEKMLPLEKFATLRDRDVLKFVVGSKAELELAKNVVDTIRNYESNCWVYLSPVFGMIEPKEIVEFMLANKMEGKIRCQLQLHKIIWDMNKRGV